MCICTYIFIISESLTLFIYFKLALRIVVHVISYLDKMITCIS